MAAVGAVAVNTNRNNSESGSSERAVDVQDSKRTSQKAQGKERHVYYACVRQSRAMLSAPAGSLHRGVGGVLILVGLTGARSCRVGWKLARLGMVSRVSLGLLCSSDNAWLNAHYDPVASIYTFSTCIGGSPAFERTHLAPPPLYQSYTTTPPLCVFLRTCSLGRLAWRR